MDISNISGVIRKINYIKSRFGIAKSANVKKIYQENSFWKDMTNKIREIKLRKNVENTFFIQKEIHGREQAEVNSLIRAASNRFGVSEKLIKSVIRAESNFNPKAVSKKGAMGYMQIMPAIAKILKIKNPFDPYENIFAGTYILSKLINKYNGNIELALSAYNAGEKIVDKHKSIPPIKETQEYVKKVLSYFKEE